MTNSQKAFDEFWKNDCRINFLKPTETSTLFWRLGWEARGKFDEEVCKNQKIPLHEDPKSRSDLNHFSSDMYNEGCEDCAAEIGKQGDE